MKIIYYTPEYLSKNYEFSEQPTKPRIDFVSYDVNGFTYTMNYEGYMKYLDFKESIGL